ncbi:MAG: hypothetical protein LBV60_19665 [Streptomyces sp.]|jgi:hypothetical protein|nr:hypothetical protein [Streptomyces sp.]
MQCPGCKSTNVEKLHHYWQALPVESPLKLEYAPPAVVEARVLAILAVIAVGFWIMFAGAALWGLAVAAGGLLWGVWMLRAVAASRAAVAEWASRQICLACVLQF